MHVKSSPYNSTHYAVLYPQNGDRIVTIESVTSLTLYIKVDHSLRVCVLEFVTISLTFCEDRPDVGNNKNNKNNTLHSGCNVIGYVE